MSDAVVPQPAVLRFLPRRLRERLESNPALVKVLTNLGWLLGDRSLRLGVGMLVGVWVARYLGPERFGLFNYAYAIAFVCLFLGNLGLDYVVVTELVKDGERKAEILGTTLALRLIGSVFACAAAMAMIFALRPTDGACHALTAIMVSVAIFQAFDTIDLWFQSQVQSKYTVIVKNTAFGVMAGVRVLLILTKASVVAFAWAVAGEAALGAILLVVAYELKGGKMGSWRVRGPLARSLMRPAWPLILSSLAVMISIRTDQIMLGKLSDNRTVGIYAAAARLTEVWYFVPSAVLSSVMPSLVEARQIGTELYYQRYSKLVRVMVALAAALVLPTTFLAHYVVVLLYGPAFADAGPILSIHVWGALFVFIGVAQGPWFVIENVSGLLLMRTVAGMLVNVGLNLVLIPRFGGLGAAFASLCGQMTCNVLMNYVQRRTRPLLTISLRALNPLNWVGARPPAT